MLVYIHKVLHFLLPLFIFILVAGGIYVYSERKSSIITSNYSTELLASQKTSPTASTNISGVPVLLYHVITPNTQRGSYGFMPLSLFTAHLDYLKQEGYTTITLDELYQYMTSKKNIPQKAIILSFDDTNESDYTIVFPELQKRGFIGVFFTIGSKANTPQWKQRLKEMHSAGMEIASHTMNHKYSGGGPATKGKRTEVDSVQTINYELNYSKKILEDIIDSDIDYLAWPGDSYTEKIINMAKESNYKGLFMAKTDYTDNIMEHPIEKSGFNKSGDDVLHIKRITMNGADSFDDFKLIIEDGVYPRPQ